MTVKNILIIDDDEYIRDYFKDVLEDKGYQVEAVDNGADGLKIFKENPFDLVFVDMMLPKTSGIDVLKQIKDISEKTIVVIISGHGTIDNAVEVMSLGALNYITKPVSLHTLEGVLARAIENKKRMDENPDSHSDTNSANGVDTDPGFTKIN